MSMAQWCSAVGCIALGAASNLIGVWSLAQGS
jgi:hypothetical protein